MNAIKLRKTGGKIEIIFYTKRSDKEPKKKEPEQLSIDDLRDYEGEALARSKRKVIDYGLNNAFNYFATLTFHKEKIDRGNIDLVLKKVKVALNNYRNRYDRDFLFIIMPEYHKDGKHIHFHGLFYLSADNNDELRKKYDKKEKKTYYISEYFFSRFGANRLEPITTTAEYCIYYASKYITKQTSKIFGDAYFCSRGLNSGYDIAEYDGSAIKYFFHTLSGANPFGEFYSPIASTPFCNVYKLDETAFRLIFPDIPLL